MARPRAGFASRRAPSRWNVELGVVVIPVGVPFPRSRADVITGGHGRAVIRVHGAGGRRQGPRAEPGPPLVVRAGALPVRAAGRDGERAEAARRRVESNLEFPLAIWTWELGTAETMERWRVKENTLGEFFQRMGVRVLNWESEKVS